MLCQIFLDSLIRHKFLNDRIIEVEAVVSSAFPPKIRTSIPRLVPARHLLLVGVPLGLRGLKPVSNAGAGSSPTPRVSRWTS